MAQITIRDIARMSGVSITAVSFVLNNKGGVSDETRKRVCEVIEKTGFKTNINSKRLFFKKSYNISIVIRKTSSPFVDLFYMEIAKGLLEKSKDYGYNLVFTDISVEDGKIILPEIIKLKDTDGIIFLQDTEKEALNEIERLKIPYVVIDAHSVNENVTSVSADYEISSFTAVNYLIHKGHRNIALISSSYIPEFYLQVFNGYKRALDEIKVSIPSYWIQIDAVDEPTSNTCMKKILEHSPAPSAVFCSTDIFAIGAMKCTASLGYKVPDDISFIAIDDIILSRYYEPGLTTIKIDKEEMGRLAMELIMQKINGKKADTIIVESDHIIERNSIRSIK